MDKEIEAVFAPLRDSLQAGEYSTEAIFDLIGGFAETNPNIAAALCYHIRDFLREHEVGDEVTESDIITEAYRRTFFDAEKAKLYGTDEFPSQGKAFLEQFTTFLISGLSMDKIVDGKCISSFHECSDHSH